MTITKTMTEKALAANRANAQKSTGPHDSSTTRQNASKHGLLSRSIKFKSEEEKQQFLELLAELNEDHKPVGTIERTLVEEIAMSVFKLEHANAWEQNELAKRRAGAGELLDEVRRHEDGKKMVFFNGWYSSQPPAQQGWNFEQLVIRNGVRGEQGSPATRGVEADHLQVEAKFSSSLDTVLRYELAIKRDLYKAIATLRDIQGERER